MNKLDPALQTEFVLTNQHGLHTRPGAVLVGIAKQFDSEIIITNLTTQGKPTNAKSLIKLMASSIKCGHTILIEVKGSDAAQAMAAVMAGFEAGLGE